MTINRRTFLHSAAAAATCEPAPRPVWVASTFVTENLFVSWDWLCRERDGEYTTHKSCQAMDIRSPATWFDIQEWITNQTLAPLWACRTTERTLMRR